MTPRKFFITGVAAFLASALFFTACDTSGDSDKGKTKKTAIRLAANTWMDGKLSSLDEEQWFTFTATAGRQYIHVRLGMIYGLYVQVYDSNNKQIGDKIRFSGSVNGYTVLTITSGDTYYIKITPYSSGSGAYRIAFSTTPSPPLPLEVLTSAKTLAEDVWANDEITATSREQWFKFTATADRQYIHISFGSSLTDLDIQVYDGSGETIEQTRSLSGWWYVKYIDFEVKSGQEYYVRTQYGSSIGAYRIMFSASNTAAD
jgi:hypothetical protein